MKTISPAVSTTKKVLRVVLRRVDRSQNLNESDECTTQVMFLSQERQKKITNHSSEKTPFGIFFVIPQWWIVPNIHQINGEAVEGPGSELETTILHVEGKVFDVQIAADLEDGREEVLDVSRSVDFHKEHLLFHVVHQSQAKKQIKLKILPGYIRVVRRRNKMQRYNEYNALCFNCFEYSVSRFHADVDHPVDVFDAAKFCKMLPHINRHPRI